MKPPLAPVSQTAPSEWNRQQVRRLLCHLGDTYGADFNVLCPHEGSIPIKFRAFAADLTVICCPDCAELVADADAPKGYRRVGNWRHEWPRPPEVITTIHVEGGRFS